MAKKIKKTFQEQLREAKSFHEMIDLVEAHLEERIQHYTERLKKRDKASNDARPHVQATLREHKSTLASLAKRRLRSESIQGNKKVPVAYRKRAAELEREILCLEHNHIGQDSLRYRKRDMAELLKQIDRHLNPPKPFALVNTAYKIGEEYARQSLTRAYDGHVWDVLDGYFENLPRAKGQKGKIKILAALPEKAEYLQVKENFYRKAIDILVDEAYEEIGDLRDEMQEAFDNMPESLQDTDVGQARSEAASQLENIADELPTLPDPITSLQIIHYPSLNQSSRADRAGDAAVTLRDVSKAVRQFTATMTKLKKAELAEIQEFCQQLESSADEIDDVRFPGMFG